MPRARHARLLEDQDVLAWHKELALGSELTANNYLRMLGKFLEEQELTPKSFLKLPSERQAALLRAYIWDDKDNLGARPGSGVIKKAIISWLKFNNRLTDHVRNVSVKGAHITRGIQRLPSKDDLKRLLNIMDAKTRLAVSLIAFGGQRPEVIGTYKGTDGLRFGDLPEAHFDGSGQLVFDRIPTRVDVRAILSKTKKPYYSFLGPEACAYLQAYVAERVARGETFTKNSPVFTLEPRQRKTYGKVFMCTANITDRIKAAMKAVGIDERPYIWRSYFSQNLERAIADGMPSTWREYWMGHTPGIAGIYALRDPSKLAEEMRQAYDKARRYIETTTIETNAALTDALSLLFKATGHDETEAKALVEDSTDEELADYIRTTFTPAIQSPLMSKETMQRIIEEPGLEAAMAEGWTVKLQLRDGRLVMERSA